MTRLLLRIRRLGRAGAVSNAHGELAAAHDCVAAASALARRVQTIDHARAAASLLAGPGSSEPVGLAGGTAARRAA